MQDADIEVTVLNEQEVEVDTHRLAGVARRTAASQHARGEISITLVDAERIAALNQTWMGAEGPTDVLSFPIDGHLEASGPSSGVFNGFRTRKRPEASPKPPILIGEVVLCPEVAGEREDLEGELDLLVAHGVLHLLGFDHDTEDAARRMREYEFEITGRSGASAT